MEIEKPKARRINIYGWDIIGADDGVLFCQKCHAEVEPEDVEDELVLSERR